jgi:hypothetical protein
MELRENLSFNRWTFQPQMSDQYRTKQRYPNNSCKPITNTAWVRARLCKLQKGCIRLVAASDKAYQLLAHGRWFYTGTPASSTTKTGRHDIAEILLKVALKHQKSKSKSMLSRSKE